MVRSRIFVTPYRRIYAHILVYGRTWRGEHFTGDSVRPWSSGRDALTTPAPILCRAFVCTRAERMLYMCLDSLGKHHGLNAPCPMKWH